MTDESTEQNRALERGDDLRAKETLSLALQLRLGFVAIIAALVAMGYASYRSAERYSESSAWVEHTDLVLRRIDRLRFTMQQAEAGERRYLETGEKRYLEPVRDASATVG